MHGSIHDIVEGTTRCKLASHDQLSQHYLEVKYTKDLPQQIRWPSSQSSLYAASPMIYLLRGIQLTCGPTR